MYTVKRILNIFLIFVSLFITLGTGAQGVANTNIPKIHYENISAKSFPSNAQIFGSLGLKETSVATANTHLQNIFAQRKNSGFDIGPCSYQLVKNENIKDLFSSKGIKQKCIKNNIISYIKHEIMINAP